MSRHAWIVRPAVALLRVTVATVVVIATIGAFYAVLLGPGVGP